VDKLYFLIGIAMAVIMLCAAETQALSNQTINVVLPSEATAIEQFAGSELSRCMLASLGWQTVSEKSKESIVFYIGSIDTQRMSTAGFPVHEIDRISNNMSDDGVYIKGSQHSVLLVGKGKRGALFAVYDFLENTVGCHWPEPGREYIPKRSELVLDGILRKVNPSLAIRGIAIHGACNPQWFGKIVDWLAKNRMNSFQLFPSHYEQVRPTVLDDILKRGLSPNIGGHSREFFYPSEKYFPANPEYFALVDGKRTKSSQVCYSEYGSVPDYAANVTAYLKSRPEIGMVGLWPNDGYGFCECEKCKSRPTTDVVLDYINRLSESVHKELPSMKMEFLSYIHYTAPPKVVRPQPYVVPTYCEYWSRSQFQPITEDRQDAKRLRKEITGWIGVSNQATIFSYYGDDCIKRYLYNPVMDVVVKDVHYYSKVGLAGNFVLLTNPESWWSNAPHVYAYTRAAWDKGITINQIEKDYYNSLYGPASKAMHAHADACRALFNLKTSQGSTGQDVLFTLGFAKFDPKKNTDTQHQFDSATTDIFNDLNNALEVTKDSFVKWKIRKLKDDAEYVKASLELVCNTHMLAATKDEKYRKASIDLIQRALACEVMNIDDKNGYRSGNNSLVGIAKSLMGEDAMWLVLKSKERSDYEKYGIWRWKTADAVPSSRDNPRRVVIDVTDRIKSAGKYEVLWDYTMGADALSMLSTGLYSGTSKEDMHPIVIDEHPGVTGAGDSENTYRLHLDNYSSELHYYIVGSIYNMRDFDTFGQVLLTKTE